MTTIGDEWQGGRWFECCLTQSPASVAQADKALADFEAGVVEDHGCQKGLRVNCGWGGGGG